MQETISRKTAKQENLKHYFTGEECTRGHIAKRWTVNAKCFACHYEENPLKRIPKKTEAEKKEASKARARRWYERNRQKTIDRAKKWKAENQESVRLSEKKWRQKKKSKAITFMRDSLRRVLKIEKNGRTEEILGYTRMDLIHHIERQFLKGMSWDNHGEWHIDHITPISVLLNR